MVSTRFLHHTLFLVMHLISAQFFFTPLASSSTVLRHVFFGLPLLRFPWGFHCSACLVISSIGFHSVWPSHPHLCFLICKSILGCFVCFHSSFSDEMQSTNCGVPHLTKFRTHLALTQQQYVLLHAQ